MVGNPKKETARRFAQMMIAPFWYFFTLGCSAGNFYPLHLLSKAGLDTSAIKEFENAAQTFSHRQMMYGFAVKPVEADKQ
jgi:hypothetical protein